MQVAGNRKRGAFALLTCVALHNRTAPDALILERVGLIEKAAADERNFVKKGVSWALRAVGRRSPALKAAAVKLTAQLAESPKAPA